MGYGGGQSLSSKAVFIWNFHGLLAHDNGLSGSVVTSRQGRVFPSKPRKFQGFAGGARTPSSGPYRPHRPPPASVAESLRLDDEPKLGERLVVGVARESRAIELERDDHRLVEAERPTGQEV